LAILFSFPFALAYQLRHADDGQWITCVSNVVLNDEGGRGSEHGGLLASVAKQEGVVPPGLLRWPTHQADLQKRMIIIEISCFYSNYIL
jgi:hypothetical protein